MAYSYTERKRIRKSFGNRDSVLEIPYLLQMQKDAYTAFLQADVPPKKRTVEGLQAAFDGVSGIAVGNIIGSNIANVLLVLGLPLLAGMWIGRRFPQLTLKVEKPLRLFALLVMLGFVALAFSRNLEQFTRHFHLFFWLVVAHNALALSIGYLSARLSGLPVADHRALTLEVGIQNSALGLVIIFTFFPHKYQMHI